MLGRLALLFVVVPLVELVLLVQLGQWIGLWPTLALVVGTGILGASLARAEGLRTWIAFQREASAGRLPGRALFDGLCILVGGAFLLTPGLLTDIAGFSLLFPPTRRWLQEGMRRRLQEQIERGTVQVRTFGLGAPWAGRDEPGGHDTAGLDPRNEIRTSDREEER